MPILLNARHEVFAQSMAVGKTAKESYLAAGFTGKHSKSVFHVSSREDIQNRIAELQEKARAQVEFTLRDAIQFCVEIIQTPPRRSRP